MDQLSTFVNTIPDFVSNHLIDWILTGTITFFTTRFATKEFYEKNRKAIATNILNNSLREILRLQNSDKLPDSAKVIFVEYKGRCSSLSPSRRNALKCRFGEPIRKTIVKVGLDVSDISSCRPVNFGVLGVANILRRPVIYNFSNGDLYMYKNGRFQKLPTTQEGESYYYKSIALSSATSTRDTMIALPIVEAEKLYGGITFDMFDLTADNKIFQHYTKDDTEEVKKEKDKINKESLSIAIKTAESLVTVYFKKKSEAKS